MRRFVTTLAAFILAGCAATGVKISEEALASLKPQQTTVDQALAALGAPTSRIRLGDGTTMLQYTYAEAKIRGASFVPIVGAFAGGSDIRTSMATLRFGADGKLIDVTSSESQYGTGIGASAGSVTPGQVPQPRQ